jgi:c-di-GMP-binding flagellar brake protein YcgR
MKEKRKSKRFPANLKVQYFLDEKEGDGKECTIINISRSGAGLNFYTADDIDVNSTLILEIFIPVINKLIDVKGIVRWLRKGKKDFVAGIEVPSELDRKELVDLIGYIQGM